MGILTTLWNGSEASGFSLAVSAPPYWIIRQGPEQIPAEFLRISEFNPFGPDFMFLFFIVMHS